MRKIWNKGHRIRASDKHLVYHFSIGTLLFVFVAVLLLLNIKQLMRTDWEHFSLLENGLTLSPYNFITILISTGVCALVAFLYYRFYYDSFKKLLHRQKLARMVLENKWYEADTVQDSGFFTDLQSRSREKIVWFPKIYYQMEKGLLHIRCEITLGKYQDQLLRLEDKLESGLYCELTDKTLHDGYIEYTLLYDMIANRITIDEVRAENGCLRLMKNLVWEYDALPHALIAGGTGGGKTYFLLTLIEALLHTDAILYILDPKNADLADLGTVMPNVYHTKEEMIDCVNSFYEGMVQRSEEIKRHPNYKTGENYAYLGLPPCFLIFDEYVAFFEMLGVKESTSLLSQLKKIVMLGRQAGYFLIVACQRPDAKYFSDGIRDNFNFRVGLGRISELGYGMLFGSDVKKQFFQKRALQLSNPSNFRELVKKDCTLDLHLSILKYQEQSIELTRNEFRILYYFFMNEDKVISKEELLEKLWNDKYYIDENVLLVNMTRLKKKMKEIGIVHLLENIRGKGWKL